jgi:tetratricopeptide (TPR) repeat protein
MSRKTILLTVISMLFAVQVFAQNDIIPNNEFYLESLRLNQLALESFEYGDYDASVGFAEEAIRYAYLSDEYAAVKLIDEAKRLLHWADINNIVNRYPNEYNGGKNYYENAVAAHSNEEWNNAIIAATKSIEILSLLEAELGGIAVLPKQYTVRTWDTEKDCLWNIAGYPWVYGNPEKWTELYEANKTKLTDPNNPNLIEPGMVLDIPSIKGEVRQGMYDSRRTYQAP